MGLCTPPIQPVVPGGAPDSGSEKVTGSFRGRATGCLSNCRAAVTLPTVMKVVGVIGAVILALAVLTFVPAIGGALSAAVGASAMSCAILGFAVGGAFALASVTHFAVNKCRNREDAPTTPGNNPPTTPGTTTPGTAS